MSQILQVFHRKERARLRNLLTILTFAVMPLSASTVLVSTFSAQNPPFESNTGNAWSVGSTGNTEIGMGFQAPSGPSSYLLTQIQVAANFSVANPDASTNPALNNLTVGIWQAATNDPNSAIELQSWSITAPASAGTPAQIYTVTSAFPTIINPTDFYFVTESVTPDGANTAEWGAQENNLTPMQIGYYSGTNGTAGSWAYQNAPCTIDPCTADNDPDASGTPAFSVSGDLVTTTPEPGNWALILSSGCLLLVLKRRLYWPAAGWISKTFMDKGASR